MQQNPSMCSGTRITIHIFQEQVASVDARAAQAMTSRSNIVRLAIRDFLQRAEATPERTQQENQAPA